jgi:hypothetical protein
MDSINKQFDNALSKIIEKEETFEEEVEKHKIKIIMQELYIDGEIKLENYLIIIISFFRI